jgi:hypothetical protein
VFGTAGRGIGFQRDLQVPHRCPVVGCTLQYGGDSRRLHQRRCPAAEEYRGQSAIGKAPGEVVDLAQKRAPPPGLVHPFAYVAVEVAVGALRKAERPVYVKRQTARLKNRRLR